jgi:hypothetical protein
MAAKQRYYPGPEPAQVTWLTNYRNKIATQGPTCGLTAGEITDTQADLDFFIFLLNVWHPALQDDVKEGTTYKTLVATGTGATQPLPAATTFTPPTARPPGVLNRLFNQVSRIKLAAAYTEAIGNDLGIIGSEDTTEHPVPEFSVKVQQGTTHQIVRIDFTKFGHKGVYIESRRNAGAWEFLGIDTTKPYLDERPLLIPNTAESREYRLRWWDDDPNGDWSPVQKVTVGP